MIPPNIRAFLNTRTAGNPTAATTATTTPLSPARCLCLHPTLPLLAYYCTNSSSSQDDSIVIQRLNTQQQLWKLPVAELLLQKKIQNMEFCDTNTVLWSGMMTTTSTISSASNQNHKKQHKITTDRSGGGGNSTSQTPLSFLIVRTDDTIIVIPYTSISLQTFRKNPLQQQPFSYLDESNLNGTTPSSNLLVAFQRDYSHNSTTVVGLVGCSDGSLKCVDIASGDILKSIKGLGKGDCIVRLLSANNYFDRDTDKNDTKRILTHTQKGIIYLIEVNLQTMEIQPPLARFSANNTGRLEYDAHRDWIIWQDNTKGTTSQEFKVHVWDLQQLQKQIILQKGSKSLFQPEPSWSALIPPHFATEQPSTTGGGGTLTTTTSLLLHPAVSSESLVFARVHSVGTDLMLTVLAASPNASSATGTVVKAAPLLSPISMRQLLQQKASSISSNSSSNYLVPPIEQLHDLQGRTSHPELLVSTNIGIFVVEFPTKVGDLSLHFGAGVQGGFGKSILYCRHSSILFSALNVLKANPHGPSSPFISPFLVHESAQPSHFPLELRSKPFRTVPHFKPSPTGSYICLFWPWEFRYEILHAATLLQRVTNRSNPHGSASGGSPLITSGEGVTDFCWVSDNDTFAVLHDPVLVQRNIELMKPKQIAEENSAGGQFSLQQVGMAGVSAGVKTGMKVASSATTAASTVASTVASTAANSASKVVKLGGKGMKKTFGIFGKKKKGKDRDTSDDFDEDGDASTIATDRPTASIIGETPRVAEEQLKDKYVELLELVAVDVSASEFGGSLAAATCSTLGRLEMRGGNRNLPTSLFGGPVLCVGSRTEENPDGYAHFYTRKQSETNTTASSYTSTGPTLPYPDIVEWDEDGRLCAIGASGSLCVYLLDGAEFIFLGNIHFSNSPDCDAKLTSVKFLHGVLYSCTWNEVFCSFLGSLEGQVCLFDTYRLASSTLTFIPPVDDDDEEYESFTPAALPLPLIQPTILGYQSGSLLVSTVRGTQSVRISHPLLRLGALLGSGQLDRARDWLYGFPEHDHEKLATFLARRGRLDFAKDLPGLSLETIVDIAMQMGDIARIEEMVEIYGVKGLRCIDMSRGLSSSISGPVETTTSVVVSIGAFLLAHGNAELTRRLASECLRLEDGKRDAFALALLLIPVDEADATRLLQRAIIDCDKDWLVGQYAKKLLSKE